MEKKIIPLLSILGLIAVIFLTSCFASSKKDTDSKVDSAPSNPTARRIKPGPSQHTVKLIPSKSALVLSELSPFKKVHTTWRSKLDLDEKVWDKVFGFLDANYQGLDPKQVCLSNDNKQNRKKIRNLNCLIIVDYTKDKMQKRLYLVDLKENQVHTLYTAHGKGSNSTINEVDLMATRFSNTSGSLQTSLGFFLTAEPYTSYKDTFGPGPQNGIKLDGISCTNNNARKRYIVMHTAKYVPAQVTDTKSIGYSEGCITFNSNQKSLMHKCMHGALVYTHGK